MLSIPDSIRSETRGVVTLTILERIIKKLKSVMNDGQKKTVCGEGAPQVYVTPGKATHLTIMQKLGLVEDKPIHKRGCGCDPKKHPKNAYGLTQKAWDWYTMCHLLLDIRLR